MQRRLAARDHRPLGGLRPVSQPTFGQLTKLSPRDYWPDEAANFTPWLAEEANIALLGDAIGLELAVDGVEVTVGSFSADIICRSLPDEHRVVIENQLERTDHDHLGKLLTYAGGLDDVHTTILLAPEIRDEHRAAIDWLNAVTIEGVHFFAVELQVWRIGDSQPAPHFDVVAKPNDWLGAVRTADKPLTHTQQLQLDYWTAFHDYLAEHESSIRPQSPQPWTWTNVALGRSGAHLAAIASTYDADRRSWDSGQNRVELYLDGDDAAEVFERLLVERDAIEEALGSLTWTQPAEGTKSRRVYASRPADLEDRDAWPEQFAWIEERLQSFNAAFRDRVKRR